MLYNFFDAQCHVSIDGNSIVAKISLCFEKLKNRKHLRVFVGIPFQK